MAAKWWSAPSGRLGRPQVVREALARGADRAIRVEGEGLAAADAAMVAEALAGAVREEQFDLVLTGLQSDDQGFAQTGVVLAELLGIPHATIIMEVQVADGRLRVKRELEGGWFQWVFDAHAGPVDDSERNQPAPLRHPQGHHGREAEGRPGGRGPRPTSPRGRRSSRFAYPRKPRRRG